MSKSISFLFVVLAFVVAGCSNSVTDVDYVERARNYLDDGKLKSAGVELKNALVQNPDNADARRLLGVVYYKLGDVAGTEKELNRAVDLGVAKESVYPLLALSLLEQRKLDALAALNLNSVSDGPEKADVLAARGLADLTLEKTDEATALIEAASIMAPKSSFVGFAQAKLLFSGRKAADAILRLETVLERDPKYAPAWNLLGEIYVSEKKLAEAENAFSRAIESRYANTSDYLARAMVLVDQGKYEAAAKDLKLLSQRLPREPKVNYLIGLVKIHDGKFDEAKNSLEKALKESPERLLPKYYLGEINFRLGNMAQAEQYAEQVYAAFPVSIAVRKLRAKVMLYKRDFVEVENLVRPIVEQRGQDAQSLDLLASALLGQNKIDEAIPLLEKITSLRPDSAIAYYRLGSALILQGEGSRAVESLEKAITKDPKLHLPRLALANHYVSESDFENALRVAADYKSADPDSPAPYNLIAGLHLNNGDETAALKAFEKALEMEPGNIIANQSLAKMAMNQNRSDVAKDHYRMIIKNHPDHVQSYVNLAILSLMEKNEAQMVDYLEQGISQQPSAVLPRAMMARHFLLKGLPEKVATIVVGLDEVGKNDPMILEVMAYAAVAEERLGDAKRLLARLLSIRENQPHLHFLLARVFAQSGESDSMKGELRRTLEISPDYFPANIASARVALLEGDRVLARERLSKARQIAPGHPEVLKVEATLARLEGRAGKASDLSRQVFDGFPTTANMLTLANDQWKAGNRQEAVEIQEDWVSRHPEDTIAALALTGLYSNLGEAGKAIAQLELTLEKDPDNVVALNEIAWKLKDTAPGQALKYASRAYQLAPESVSILDTLAYVQLKNNQIDLAERSIERALSKAPNNPSVRYHSAMIAEGSGDINEATRILSGLLRDETQFPERDEAERMLRRLESN